MDSVDLKLRITGTPGAYKVMAQLDNVSAESDLGELPDNLRQQLEPLQKSILLTTEGLRTRSLGPAQPRPESSPSPVNAAAGGGRILNFVAGADLRNIQEIGSKLFNCLFQQDVYALYRKALKDAQKKTGADLPIKLYVEPSELAYIPWETMFDKKALVHLCCYGMTPFARTATFNFDDIYIYDKAPINILGMISAPRSFIGTPSELDTDAEQAALDHALAPLSKQVNLCWTTSGTFRELERRVIKGNNGKRWDVFLFIGHGLRAQHRARGRRRDRFRALIRGCVEGPVDAAAGTQTCDFELVQRRSADRPGRSLCEHRRNLGSGRRHCSRGGDAVRYQRYHGNDIQSVFLRQIDDGCAYSSGDDADANRSSAPWIL
jgi:hypothetical protein